MFSLPEGIRRVCIVVGLIAVIGWLFFIGKTPLQWLDMRLDHLAYTAAISLAAYLSPFIVCRIVIWVKDGFTKAAN
ncbi:hypothetical protein [Pseudomonas sp. NUPR-001]|uniref:hypothetical protein n=1 Tax=Pseudomonas sp. NUPR-001 TaxID=3416058 RepID=UPI003F968D24